MIERADIERLQAGSVAELLRFVPGVSLTNTGGPGKNVAVNIRSSKSNVLRWSVAHAPASMVLKPSAPTFNQLYYPGFGNPDIEAESSRNLEIGLDGDQAWGRWSVTAFRNEIDDLIAYFNQGAGFRAYETISPSA